MPGFQAWDQPADQSGWDDPSPWSGLQTWDQPIDDLGWGNIAIDPWSGGPDKRLILFWLKGIEAAERGETLRLEQHFQERDRKEPMKKPRVREGDTNGWSSRHHEGWGTAYRASSKTGSCRNSDLKVLSNDELVEQEARRRCANIEQKQKYYEFCNVSSILSTTEWHT